MLHDFNFGLAAVVWFCDLQSWSSLVVLFEKITHLMSCKTVLWCGPKHGKGGSLENQVVKHMLDLPIWGQVPMQRHCNFANAMGEEKGIIFNLLTDIWFDQKIQDVILKMYPYSVTRCCTNMVFGHLIQTSANRIHGIPLLQIYWAARFKAKE